MAPEKDSETFLMKVSMQESDKECKMSATNRITHWLKIENN